MSADRATSIDHEEMVKNLARLQKYKDGVGYEMQLLAIVQSGYLSLTTYSR
jgi:hypothetical protein